VVRTRGKGTGCARFDYVSRLSCPRLDISMELVVTLHIRIGLARTLGGAL
jgi:hypothetical protein